MDVTGWSNQASREHLSDCEARPLPLDLEVRVASRISWRVRINVKVTEEAKSNE